MPRSQGRENIVEEIRLRVRDGRYQNGDRLPSERALAREFGVSRALIQSAIDSLESIGLLTRLPNCRPIVRAVPTKRMFGPAHSRDTIAVWIQPNLDDLGAASILQGIRSEIGERGYSIVIGLPPDRGWSTGQRSETEFLRKIVQEPGAAGAIVWETGGPGFASVYPDLVQARIPLVFVDREPPEVIEADVVATNHRRGAKKAVQHLIDLGHRSIAMVVNDEPVSSVRDRVEGYKSALADAGIPFRPELVRQMKPADCTGDLHRRNVCAMRLLEAAPKPTAIFAVNDQTALSLLEAWTSMGIRVPQDVSLVGFDWLLRSLPSGGELTTVAQPFEAIGRIAARRLLEQIEGIDPAIPRHILLEAPLVVKSTTAAPRSHPTHSVDSVLVNS